MFDPNKGQWWREPPARQFEAYYMTLRVHYALPALEAFRYAKERGPLIGVGQRDGVVGLIKQGIDLVKPRIYR